MIYAVKLTNDLELLAFDSRQAAEDHGEGFFVFGSADDLINSSFSHEDLMAIHYFAKGHETGVKNPRDRSYLCDIIFDFIDSAGLQPEGSEAVVEPEPVIEPVVVEIAAPEEPPAKYSLKSNPAVPYTQREREVFGFLAKRNLIEPTIEHLIDFIAKKGSVSHPRATVFSVLKSIHRKMIFNDEPFEIKKIKRSGSTLTKFQIQEREQ